MDQTIMVTHSIISDTITPRSFMRAKCANVQLLATAAAQALSFVFGDLVLFVTRSRGQEAVDLFFTLPNTFQVLMKVGRVIIK